MSKQGKTTPVLEQAPARPEAVLQRRGVARVNAILDTAEQLLEERGYDGATLKAISERTGIPAASVYHYFADRYQVDAALMRRHIDGLAEAVGDMSGMRTIADMADRVLDPMIEYFREHRACTELWFRGRSEALAALAADFDAGAAETVWRLAIEGGILAADTPLEVAQIAYGAGNALFDRAFKTDSNGDEFVLNETKRMVTAYLSNYAPERD